MRPRRLVWPRTSAFHADNVGSNPAGDTPRGRGRLRGERADETCRFRASLTRMPTLRWGVSRGAAVSTKGASEPLGGDSTSTLTLAAVAAGCPITRSAVSGDLLLVGRPDAECRGVRKAADLEFWGGWCCALLLNAARQPLHAVTRRASRPACFGACCGCSRAGRVHGFYGLVEYPVRS